MDQEEATTDATIFLYRATSGHIASLVCPAGILPAFTQKITTVGPFVVFGWGGGHSNRQASWPTCGSVSSALCVMRGSHCW